MTRAEYHFFLGQRLKQHCILGNDYYVTNEHLVSADGSTRAAGEIFGYHVITSQYYERYRLPVMHTETNLQDGPNGEAEAWLRKQWANVLRVRNDGMPILGFTWYSLTDQVDWDTALREPNGRVNPLGLYDLDRNIRPVGAAYRELIREWRTVLPTQSVVLSLPAFPPSRQGDPLVLELAAESRGRRKRQPPATTSAPVVPPPDGPEAAPVATVVEPAVDPAPAVTPRG